MSGKVMQSDGAAFSDRLLPGEHVVWSGAPRQGLCLTARDVFLIPFSAVWLGFAVAWTVGATIAGGAFGLFGLPFVVVGLLVFVGRFWLDGWFRKMTTYAVTDQRVLINRSGAFSDFTAINLDRLPDVRIVDGKAGRGTIRFGQRASPFSGNGFSFWLPSLDGTPQFLGIEDAWRVFNLVQRPDHRPRSEGQRAPA